MAATSAVKVRIVSAGESASGTPGMGTEVSCELTWSSSLQDLIPTKNSIISTTLATMGNILFHHSVPNNVPALFWIGDNLFSGRDISGDLTDLFKVREGGIFNKETDLVKLLILIKNRITKVDDLMVRLEAEEAYVQELIENCKEKGYLTIRKRIGKEGLLLLKKINQMESFDFWNRELYIPSAWCV